MCIACFLLCANVLFFDRWVVEDNNKYTLATDKTVFLIVMNVMAHSYFFPLTSYHY